MARAARLSGDIDEEEQEVEELMQEQRNAEHLVCTVVSAPCCMLNVTVLYVNYVNFYSAAA